MNGSSITCESAEIALRVSIVAPSALIGSYTRGCDGLLTHRSCLRRPPTSHGWPPAQVHAASIARLSLRRHLLPFREAADLEVAHDDIDAMALNQLAEGVLRMQRLPAGDRHVERRGNASQTIEVLRIDGIFNPVGVERRESTPHPD